MWFPELCLGELERRTDSLQPWGGVHTHRSCAEHGLPTLGNCAHRSCAAHGFPALGSCAHRSCAAHGLPALLPRCSPQTRGERWFPSSLGVTLGWCRNALFCSHTSLFFFCLFSPFCAERPSTPRAPGPQRSLRSSSWESSTLGSAPEGEVPLPRQGLLLLWPQKFLAMKETGFSC